jgi:hypothetical protein
MYLAIYVGTTVTAPTATRSDSPSNFGTVGSVFSRHRCLTRSQARPPLAWPQQPPTQVKFLV